MSESTGADDNATGVTGVISLADAYAALETRPKRTLIFMAFWGEESGLLGSFHFVKKPLWPLEKIVANINLEMIGRPESGARNKTWVTGWNESNLGSMMAVGAKRVGTMVFEHPRFSGKMLYGASDNWPFVQKGVVAHSFSAGSLATVCAALHGGDGATVLNRCRGIHTNGLFAPCPGRITHSPSGLFWSLASFARNLL